MRRISSRRVLLAAVVIAVGIGIGALVYYLAPDALGPYDSAGQQQTATATVTRKASCGASDPHDTVTFSHGGKQQQALLNGCGNTKGAQLRIVVPDTVDEHTVVALAAAKQGTIPAGYRRLGVALLVLGCVAGTSYAFLVRRRRDREGGDGGPGGGPGEPDTAEAERRSVSGAAVGEPA